MSLTLNRRRLRNQDQAKAWVQVPDADFGRLGMTREQAQGLLSGFDGTLVFPWNPAYDQDRKLANPAFDKRPGLIAYCISEHDVRTILRLCQGKLIPGVAPPMVIRSGGHSEAGYSAIDGGVILDVSGMASLMIDPQARRLHLGPGAEFDRVWEAMGGYGLVVTAGVCPNVRIAGYMQGGGYGWTARMFGMNCDNVVEVEMMLADGSVVVANDTVNADLHYAVCGGTGNNFGVLLRATYRLYPMKEAHGFSIVWDLSSDDGPANGAAALDLMQRTLMGSNTDHRIGMHVLLAYQGENVPEDMKPYLLLRAMFNGSREEGCKVLKPIRQTNGAVPQWDKHGTVAELNDLLIDKPYPIPQFPKGVSILPEAKESRYLQAPLGVDNWRRVVDFFLSSPDRLNKYTIAAIETAGAAINAVPRGTNAYVHRETDGDIFLDVFWRDDHAGEKERALAYLHDWVELIEPLSNGHVYQNYPSASLDRWWWRYWGEAVPVLVRVKNKYDPQNLFNFPQGIAEIPESEGGPLPADLAEPVARALDQPVQLRGG